MRRSLTWAAALLMAACVMVSPARSAAPAAIDGFRAIAGAVPAEWWGKLPWNPAHQKVVNQWLAKNVAGRTVEVTDVVREVGLDEQSGRPTLSMTSHTEKVKGLTVVWYFVPQFDAADTARVAKMKAGDKVTFHATVRDVEFTGNRDDQVGVNITLGVATLGKAK